MRHPVSGEVRELSEAEFLALFDPALHEQIRRLTTRPGVEAVVCFENLDVGASEFGHRTALFMGPGCTYGLGEIENGCRLGDVPSRFQYPTAFWRLLPAQPTAPPNRDFVFYNAGSILLWTPLTPAAHAWLDEHCPPGSDHLYHGTALVVEPRYHCGLVTLARRDGLVV